MLCFKKSSEWKDKEYLPTVNVLKIVPCPQKESKKRKKTLTQSYFHQINK